MLLYLAFFLLIAAFCILELTERGAENKGAHLLLLCILLCLMAGFRTRGYDYDSYNEIYRNVRVNFSDGDVEAGFKLLCRLMPTYRGLLVAMSCLTFIPLYCVLRKESFYPAISILLLYTTLQFPSFMGQMRQGLAMAVMLFAYYRQEDRLLFFTCFIVSIAFHLSALVTLLYLLPLRKQYPLYIYAIVFSASLLFSIGAAFGGLLSLFMGTGGLMASKLLFYSYAETEQGISYGMNLAVLIRLFIFLLAYHAGRGDRSQIDPRILNLYFISIVFYLFFGFLPQVGGRGSVYFLIFDIILVPQILASGSDIISVPKIILTSSPGQYVTSVPQLVLTTSPGQYRAGVCLIFIALSALRFMNFWSDEFNQLMFVPYF